MGKLGCLMTILWAALTAAGCTEVEKVVPQLPAVEIDSVASHGFAHVKTDAIGQNANFDLRAGQGGNETLVTWQDASDNQVRAILWDGSSTKTVELAPTDDLPFVAAGPDGIFVISQVRDGNNVLRESITAVGASGAPAFSTGRLMPDHAQNTDGSFAVYSVEDDITKDRVLVADIASDGSLHNEKPLTGLSGFRTTLRGASRDSEGNLAVATYFDFAEVPGTEGFVGIILRPKNVSVGTVTTILPSIPGQRITSGGIASVNGGFANLITDNYQGISDCVSCETEIESLFSRVDVVSPDGVNVVRTELPYFATSLTKIGGGVAMATVEGRTKVGVMIFDANLQFIEQISVDVGTVIRTPPQIFAASDSELRIAYVACGNNNCNTQSQVMISQFVGIDD